MQPTFKPLAFARVDAFLGGISFASQDGFNPTPQRIDVGYYRLILAEPPSAGHQTVTLLTRYQFSTPGEISTAVNVNDDTLIEIKSWDSAGNPIDVGFSVLVYEATK
jgi:hypothetical protein